MGKKVDSLPTMLENEQVVLRLLSERDFEDLYAIAQDARIWEQHPDKDRWKKENFRAFFYGALQSNSAFKIVDKSTGDPIGCTRFYNYNAADSTIFIGYTFYAVSCWGTGVNRSVKKLMLDYIFQTVANVYFHIGTSNRRSQIAIERIGADKLKEEVVAYPDGTTRWNCLYQISKEKWQKLNANDSRSF